MATSNTAVLTAAYAQLFVLGRIHKKATCCWCGSAMSAICDEKYWRCPKFACFDRQLDYAIAAADGDILFIPLPIQVDLFDAVVSGKYTSVLSSGSRGTSKSVSLRWLAHYLCMKYPNFRVILLRRTFPELKESHLINIQAEADSMKADYRGNPDYVLTYANGSRLKFGHAEHGVTQYLSAAYDLVLLDEETTFEQGQITDISACARRSTYTPKGWVPCTVGATNPGGLSGNYTRAVFIEKQVDPVEQPGYDPDEYHCIFSRLEDNAYIDTDEYDKQLRKLGATKYRQWRYGDWDVFDGQFFNEWRTKDDDTGAPVKRAHVLTTDNYPDFTNAYDRFCSLHWGLKQSGICLWWVCLLDGTFFIEDEYVFGDLTASRVAKEIKQRNAKRKISIRHIVAGEDLWNRKGQTGESLVESFRKEGLSMRKSKHDRVMGWNRVHALLDVDEEGMPWLRVAQERCKTLCTTLPALVGDPAKPEDIITAPRQRDAAANAIRYGAMSRPQPSHHVEIPEELLKGKAGGWRYELLN